MAVVDIFQLRLSAQSVGAPAVEATSAPADCEATSAPLDSISVDEELWNDLFLDNQHVVQSCNDQGGGLPLQ